MESDTRPSSQQSSKSKKSAFPAYPPHISEHGDETPNLRSVSRLRRVSGAAARRLSTLSFISIRTTFENRDRNKSQQGRVTRSTSEAPASGTSRSSTSSARSDLDSPTSESGDSLGELPQFGISERGYLASLVSLFSADHMDHDDNGSITSPISAYTANTTFTAPTTEGSNLGLYEYDLNSPDVYQFSKSQRLYVGWPSIIHPPPEALLEFEMETLPSLERNLETVSKKLGQQGIRITYELRMSGSAGPNADTVTLVPTVWILYRSYRSHSTKAYVAELHKAVPDTLYINKAVEIHEGGGRIELTSDQRPVDAKPDAKESIKFSGGRALSVHVENYQNETSVCGALCCVTTINEDDQRHSQSLCRIGGLLKINGKYVLGVSTAHAMLNGSGIFKDSFNDPPEPTARAAPAETKLDHETIVSESGRVQKWSDITRDAVVDFLGVSMNSRGEMAINRSKPDNATDFALLRLGQMPWSLRNQYVPPHSDVPVAITSTASATATSLGEEPIYILCGGGQVIEGQLVWGSASYIIRGRNFHVRRIQTSKPLNPSASGAWVVKGEVLYGVIIAAYEDEPFALMMTVDRLFASIMGSAFSIRSVELWDGKIPDELRVNNDPKGKSRKLSTETTKKSVKVENKSKGPEKKELAVQNPAGEGSSKDAALVYGRQKTRSNTVSRGTQTEIEPSPLSSQPTQDSQAPAGPSQIPPTGISLTDNGQSPGVADQGQDIKSSDTLSRRHTVTASGSQVKGVVGRSFRLNAGKRNPENIKQNKPVNNPPRATVLDDIKTGGLDEKRAVRDHMFRSKSLRSNMGVK